MTDDELIRQQQEIAEHDRCAKWLKSFSISSDENLREMKVAAFRFIQSMVMGDRPRWLSLIGPSGIGKTMLAQCVWRYVRNDFIATNPTSEPDGDRSHFWDWRAVAESLQSRQWSVMDDIIRARFAVLDDIGAEYDPSGMVKHKLDRVLNCRQHKWTIITSNLSLDQIGAQLDDRIASRMLRHGSVVIECLDVPDWNTRDHEGGDDVSQ